MISRACGNPASYIISIFYLISAAEQACLSMTGPEVIKLFSYSTQLGTKFTLLINVKMPTIVGIFTFLA